jgi:hypothetical protein
MSEYKREWRRLKMGFKLPDEHYERQRELHELKYINFKGKQIHVSKLQDKSVTTEMKDQMKMNSYAQDDLPPKLTNEALIETVKHYKDNCSRPLHFPCSTYDESIIHVLVPEMVKRLEELMEENEKYQEALKDISKQPTFIPDNKYWDMSQTIDDMTKIAGDALE